MQVAGILFDIINNVQIWLIILLATFTCVLPYIIYRRWEVIFYDDIINNLRHDKYEQDYTKKKYIRKIEAITKYTRSVQKFRKIFSKNEDFEPENLADKKIKTVVDGFRSSRKSRYFKDNQDNVNMQSNNFNSNFPINNTFDKNNNIEKTNFRKFSNNDERERASSLENNNNYNRFVPQIKNSKNSINDNSNLKNFADKNNMNINIINNNIISSNNNGVFDPNTYSIGRTESQHFRFSGANVPSQMQAQNSSNQPFKNKSSSNTNHQNSSSNNFNYNYIHPYDEEDLINEHLGGKFKPITNTTRRVLNPNDSYERDFKIVSRENNKFEFNFNKFKNTNSNNSANNTNFNNNNINVNNNFNNNGNMGVSLENNNYNSNNLNNNISNINNINKMNNNDKSSLKGIRNLISDDNDNDQDLMYKNKVYIQENIDNIDNVNVGNLEQDDFIVRADLKRTTEFYNPNDSNRNLMENEKVQSKSQSKKSLSKKQSTENMLVIPKEISSKIYFHISIRKFNFPNLYNHFLKYM